MHPKPRLQTPDAHNPPCKPPQTSRGKTNEAAGAPCSGAPAASLVLPNR